MVHVPLDDFAAPAPQVGDGPVGTGDEVDDPARGHEDPAAVLGAGDGEHATIVRAGSGPHEWQGCP